MSGICKQLLAVFSVSIVYLNIGTTLGWPSSVIPQIIITGQPMNMTQNEIALTVSIMFLGSIVTPIPAGFLMEIIGTKSTLLCLSFMPLASWILIYFAKKPIHLFVARFLAGCWYGISFTLVPPYIAEISDAQFRGAFTTILQFMCNLGLLFAFYIGSIVDYYTFAYILGGIPIIFVIIFSFMPETPYWYVKKGRHEKAVKSLVWLRAKKSEKVKEEVEEIEATITKKMQKKVILLDLFRDRETQKALLTVEFLAILQRASGMSSVKAYLSTTLPEGGTGSLSINDSITIIGVVITVSVLVSTFLTDRLGRKPLLIFSSLGSGFSMLVASVWFFLDSNTTIDVSSYAWIPFVSIFSYNIFLYMGLGVLVMAIQGELFSTTFRGIASGITGIILALTSFTMDLSYMQIAESVGMYLNYFIFAFSAFAAAIFSYYYLAETKGKTLYQIQQKLKNRNKRNNPL